jgi:SPP1 family predicted phage head-tail adaptor
MESSLGRKIDRQIILQVATVTRGTDGAEVQSWTTHDTVWAMKLCGTSREVYAAQKVNAEVTNLYKMRYRYLANARMRILDEGRTYDVIGVDDADPQKKELRLLAKEVV